MSFDPADPILPDERPTAGTEPWPADGEPSSGTEPDDLFARIHLLATAQAEGRLTADAAARLESLVIGDPAARRLYVEYVRETASLRWYGGGAATAPVVAGDAPAAFAPRDFAQRDFAQRDFAQRDFAHRDLVRLDDDADLADGPVGPTIAGAATTFNKSVLRPAAAAARGGAAVPTRAGDTGAAFPATGPQSLDGQPFDSNTSLNGFLDRSMVLPALSADLLAVGEDDADEPAPLPSPASIPMPVPPRFDRRRILRWSAAAAAVLMLGTGGWWVVSRGLGTAPNRGLIAGPVAPSVAPATRPAAVEPVATLIADVGVTWDGSAWPDGRVPLVGDRMLPGPWVLTAGAVRFTMDGGADVIVHGPARFDLPSGKQVLLSAGRLTAHAGKGAVGFEVTTPAADVVDLGTEFGVTVGSDGATEAHVLAGRVALAARASPGPPVAVSASAAGRVEAGGRAVAAVAFRPTDFAHGLPLVDLADVVAGGDGTQGRRGAGVDVTTGTPVDAPPAANRLAAKVDGKFHPVPGRPMLAGVFAPVPGERPVQLDPAGHTFDKFPVADASSWYWLWAGGAVPMLDPKQGFEAYPSTLGGVDYAAKDHGLLFMQPNKGVTFDLAAMRAAHPSRRFRQFKAVCGNTSAQIDRTLATEKSDVWVFVDGKLAFSRHPMLRGAPPIDVAVDLPPDARYLTLVVTDGGDRLQSDWVTFGDPRLE